MLKKAVEVNEVLIVGEWKIFLGEYFWPIIFFISSKQNYGDEEGVNTL
jgi:hypothetical protein